MIGKRKKKSAPYRALLSGAAGIGSAAELEREERFRAVGRDAGATGKDSGNVAGVCRP